MLSKLYKLGKNLSKTISNVEFQKKAEAKNITSKHFNFKKRGFLASDEKLSEAKAKLIEASEVLREGAKELFIAKRNEQEDKIVTTTEILRRICEKSLFDSVILKWKASQAKRESFHSRRREKKLLNLSRKHEKRRKVGKDDCDTILLSFNEFFMMVQKKCRRRKRKVKSEYKKKQIQQTKKQKLKIKKKEKRRRMFKDQMNRNFQKDGNRTDSELLDPF